jgi:hypothetical protein
MQESLMSEQYKISDVLADESHPAHDAAKKMMEGLRTGEISLCGCLGPQYGEPYCPCRMEREGLGEQMRSNPLRIEANRGADERLAKLFAEMDRRESGGD